MRLETPDVAPNRFFVNNTMPFALAGFAEVEQEKPGVFRVKNFARNGQLLSRNVTELPEVAEANASSAPHVNSSFSIVFARRIKELEAAKSVLPK